MGSVVFAQNCVWSEIREIGLFRKVPFWRHFAHFFRPPFLEALFFPWCSSGLSQKCRRGGHTRNATKQGVSDRFPVFVPRRLLLCFTKLRFCGPNSTIIFSACYYFLFSEVRIFDEIGFWGSKTRWGCRAEVVLRSVFLLRCVGRARKFDARWARGRDNFLSGLASIPKMASPLRCGGFSRLFRFFFWRPLFRKLQVVLFTPPSFCLGDFLFCSPSSWDWGQRRIARVFLGSWPSTFLFFGVFWGLFTETLFFPWKRVILVHFSVSPFRSPWLLSLLFVTLSLSLSPSLLFFFFLFFYFSLPCCLVFIFTFLVFWLFFVVLFLRFCFMKRTTSKYYICKFDFHKLSLCFFDSSFTNMFLSLFLFIIQVICFGAHQCFSSFPRRPFLKHQFWFCTLWKVIVFFRVHFGGNFGWRSRNTVKIGISAHC